MDINTIEEARAEIIRLQEENTRLENERDTLSQNNKDLETELGQVRTLNQTYFNKLSAQISGAESKDMVEDEKEAPSCEEFARSINIF